MSAREEYTRTIEIPRDLGLGSLPQYDSGDLKELVQGFNKDGSNEAALKHAIQSITQGRPDTAKLEHLATVATNNPTLATPMNQAQSDEPWLEIIEQPKSKGIRFRYKCEGRSAGSIPGETSTNEHKTFPQVKINNFKGPAAIVVVSCVTKDEPYRPHPHTLVGKECRKGVCTIKLKRSNVATFPNLGIQCVTKKEIKDSLKEREQIRVDPFGTGYFDSLSKLHLNIVRLCFQAFLPDEAGQYTRIVAPVVSQCIFDKKAVNDLVICRLSKQSGHVKGGDEVFMLCEKVNKDDIQVRFFEEVDDETIWENYAEFNQSDVHRQFAIVFKTPPYKDQSISRPVEVQMQLFRPSDEGSSEAKVFQYIPNDPDPEGIEKKRKRNMNFGSFFADTNNPNTPAFSLLTDNIKEEPESTSATVRERLKGKVARGRRRGGAASAMSKNDVPQYSLANTGAAAGEAPAIFQSYINHVGGNEVIIQTSDIPQLQPGYSNQMAATALTQLGMPVGAGHQPGASGSSMANRQRIVIMPDNLSTKPLNGSDDSEDIMLEDIPVGRMVADNMKPADEEIQFSLPSISNMDSMDLNSLDFAKFTGDSVGNSKLQMDSAGPSKPSKLQTDSEEPERKSSDKNTKDSAPRGRKPKK